MEARLATAIQDISELRKQLTAPLVIDTRGMPARWKLSQREAQLLRLYMQQDYVAAEQIRILFWPDQNHMPFNVVGVVNTIRNKIKTKISAAGTPVRFDYVRGYGTRLPKECKAAILAVIQSIPK